MDTVAIPEEPFALSLPEKGGFSIVMIGASRSGKTTAMKHIVDKYLKGKLLFFTSFNNHHEIYKTMPKHTIIANDFHPEVLRDFHILQQESKNKYKAVFIYDDAIGPQLKNHKEITRLFSVYRNADMCGLFSAQAPTLVSPVGRANANYILLFKLNAASEVETACKDFLRSYFPKDMRMNERIQWYVEATADHHFICIDNINSTICRCRLTSEQVG